MSKNRATVTLPVELNTDLAKWLAAEAITRNLSPAQLLAKLAGEFRQRIENEDGQDAAEADAAIDAIERGEMQTRPLEDVQREIEPPKTKEQGKTKAGPSSGKKKETRKRRTAATQTDPLRTVAWVANELGRHPETIRKWISEGRLTAHKNGTSQQARVLVRESEVQAFKRAMARVHANL